MGVWTVTPASDKCFDLLGYVLFQALAAYLLVNSQSLAGPSRDESFRSGLLLASPHKNSVTRSPKAADAFQYLGFWFRH